VRRDADPSAPFSIGIEVEIDMNIDSIQAPSPPQRPVTTEAAPQLAKQAKISATQPQLQKSAKTTDNTNPDAGQKNFSVEEAVKRLTDFVALTTADINFSIDEASGVQVVKIMDRKTKEVIRQFPSEEAIRIAQALDQLQGVFVKDKV
jgi:flagellar protein FlaG